MEEQWEEQEEEYLKVDNADDAADDDEHRLKGWQRREGKSAVMPCPSQACPLSAAG